MTLDEWRSLEIDGFKGTDLVAVPMFAAEAALVRAAAARMGFRPSTLLHIVVGLGLAMIERHGPMPPAPTVAPSAPPAETNEEA